jgi:hypothetical protein
MMIGGTASLQLGHYLKLSQDRLREMSTQSYRIVMFEASLETPAMLEGMLAQG